MRVRDLLKALGPLSLVMSIILLPHGLAISFGQTCLAVYCMPSLGACLIAPLGVHFWESFGHRSPSFQFVWIVARCLPIAPYAVVVACCVLLVGSFA